MAFYIRHTKTKRLMTEDRTWTKDADAAMRFATHEDANTSRLLTFGQEAGDFDVVERFSESLDELLVKYNIRLAPSHAHRGMEKKEPAGIVWLAWLAFEPDWTNEPYLGRTPRDAVEGLLEAYSEEKRKAAKALWKAAKDGFR